MTSSWWRSTCPASPDAIELDVERNVLTVKAERRPTAAGDDVELEVAERPLGVFSRQLFLGEPPTSSTSPPATTRAS